MSNCLYYINSDSGRGEPPIPSQPSIQDSTAIAIANLRLIINRPLVYWAASIFTVSKLNHKMLIIKSSFVAAILSSLLFLEADCVAPWATKEIPIDKESYDFDPSAVWVASFIFNGKAGPLSVAHPATGDYRLFLRYREQDGYSYLENEWTEPATYVYHDYAGLKYRTGPDGNMEPYDYFGKMTAETEIKPGEIHALKTNMGLVYTKWLNQIP